VPYPYHKQSGNPTRSVASHNVAPKLGKSRLNTAISQKTHVPTKGIDNRARVAGAPSGGVGQTVGVTPLSRAVGQGPQAFPEQLLLDDEGRMQPDGYTPQRKVAPATPANATTEAANRALERMRSGAASPAEKQQFERWAQDLWDNAGFDEKTKLGEVLMETGYMGRPQAAQPQAAPAQPQPTPAQVQTGTAQVRHQGVQDFTQEPVAVPQPTPAQPQAPQESGQRPRYSPSRIRQAFEDPVGLGTEAKATIQPGVAPPRVTPANNASAFDVPVAMPPQPQALSPGSQRLVAEAQQRGQVNRLQGELARRLEPSGISPTPDPLTQRQVTGIRESLAADPAGAPMEMRRATQAPRRYRDLGRETPTYRDPRLPDGSAPRGETIEVGIAGGGVLPFTPAREGDLYSQQGELRDIMARLRAEGQIGPGGRSLEERTGAIDVARERQASFGLTEEEKQAQYRERLQARAGRREAVQENAAEKAEARRERLQARQSGPTPLQGALMGMAPGQRAQFMGQLGQNRLGWEAMRQQGQAGVAQSELTRAQADKERATAEAMRAQVGAGATPQAEAAPPTLDRYGEVVTPLPEGPIPVPEGPLDTPEKKATHAQSQSYQFVQEMLGVPYKADYETTMESFMSRLADDEPSRKFSREEKGHLVKYMEAQDKDMMEYPQSGWQLLKNPGLAFPNERIQANKINRLRQALTGDKQDWGEARKIAKESLLSKRGFLETIAPGSQVGPWVDAASKPPSPAERPPAQKEKGGLRRWQPYRGHRG